MRSPNWSPQSSQHATNLLSAVNAADTRRGYRESMRGLRVAFVALSLVAALSGCAGDAGADPTQSGVPMPSIDPALIPDSAPSDIVTADITKFDSGFGEYTFRVGEGLVWCTINSESNFVVCEQNEASAQYQPIPIPDTCDFSYGYQVRMWAQAPSGSPIVDMPCSGGAYADPTGTEKLQDREKVLVNGITCWVDQLNVRCDNEAGNYIALGPEIWALH